MVNPQNKQIILAERPAPGAIDIEKVFRLNTVPVPTEDELKDGQALVRTIYTSLDPAMRGWISEGRSYVEPVAIGAVMRAGCVGQVVLSKHADWKVGDYVSGYWGWQEFAVVSTGYKLPAGLDIKHALSALGATGMTAYFGLFDIGKPKEGETVVVSGAAGATGSIVGQLAKAIGCKVIGIAGTEDKCKWLVDDLGFDVALNYKDVDFKEKLAEATPKYIDIYFDNVGGDILDACLHRLNLRGRVVLCGAISQYNAKEKKGPAAYMTLIQQRGRMEGFIVSDYIPRFAEGQQYVGKLLKEGKVKDKQTVVQGGIESAPKGLLKLFAGENTGKMIVQVSQDVASEE